MATKRKATEPPAVENALAVDDGDSATHALTVSGPSCTWEAVEGLIATSLEDAVSFDSYQIVIFCKFLNAARLKGSNFDEAQVHFFLKSLKI